MVDGKPITMGTGEWQYDRVKGTVEWRIPKQGMAAQNYGPPAGRNAEAYGRDRFPARDQGKGSIGLSFPASSCWSGPFLETQSDIMRPLARPDRLAFGIGAECVHRFKRVLSRSRTTIRCNGKPGREVTTGLRTQFPAMPGSRKR